MTLAELEARLEALTQHPDCSDRCRVRWQQWTHIDGDTYHARINGQWKTVKALGRGPVWSNCKAHRAFLLGMIEDERKADQPDQ